jgi:hypothetical protein
MVSPATTSTVVGMLPGSGHDVLDFPSSTWTALYLLEHSATWPTQSGGNKGAFATWAEKMNGLGMFVLSAHEVDDSREWGRELADESIYAPKIR